MDQQKRLFQKPNQQRPVNKEEGCKIKIKNTKGGKEIKFSGNCSKNQLKIAQGNIADSLDDED